MGLPVRAGLRRDDERKPRDTPRCKSGRVSTRSQRKFDAANFGFRTRANIALHWRAMKPEPLQDWSALMAAAQDGDATAYGELLRAITPYLRAVARRSGLEGDEIEDGVQDILLTVHSIR